LWISIESFDHVRSKTMLQPMVNFNCRCYNNILSFWSDYLTNCSDLVNL